MNYLIQESATLSISNFRSSGSKWFTRSFEPISKLSEYDRESLCATQVMSSAILAHSNLPSGIGSWIQSTVDCLPQTWENFDESERIAVMWIKLWIIVYNQRVLIDWSSTKTPFRTQCFLYSFYLRFWIFIWWHIDLRSIWFQKLTLIAVT